MEETKTSASAPPLVKVISVSKAPATTLLTLPGATAAWYESTIYARVDGYVGNWTADIGDKVKKGQVLATIETPDLDAQLAATKALVVSRKAAADFAKTTYERWRGSPKGVVSEQEREAKKAEFNSAEAQLRLAQADVDRYTALAQFKQVVAPYDGTITERRIDIGNLVTAGSSASTTLLYRMMQSDPMRVFVDVPQSAASNVGKDVTASITANNIPDHIFKGKVTRTADAIDPQARTLRVEVDIPNHDQILVPGMYVNVSFDIPSTGSPQVPAAVLVFRSGGPEVAVVNKDNTVTFHKVIIARDNGNTVEIASGLSVGDQAALNISNQIMDGEKVQISEEEHSDNDKAEKR
jgi:RND family efflux transporter MFP subunit